MAAIAPTPTWVDMWLQAVWDRSHSRDTRAAYRRALARFEEWWGSRPLLAVRPADAARYAAHLRGSGLGPAAQAQTLAALRSLYAFAARKGVVAHSPFAATPLPKSKPTTSPRILAADEAALLVSAARPRGRALILLLGTTGLGISEALAARWVDVAADEAGRAHLRVTGRQGKVRAVRLLPEVLAALDAVRNGDYLLPARGGGRWSRQGADAMLARLAARAGLGGSISTRSFRYLLAAQAAAAGAPLTLVQRDLGHAALTTTQRFLRVAAGLHRTATDYVAGAGWLRGQPESDRS